MSIQTRVAFGCHQSKNYMCIGSKELIECVVQLPPSDNKCMPDKTIFYLPMSATNNGKNCIIEVEDVPGRMELLQFEQSCTPETCTFNHIHSKGKEAFSNITIHRETVKSNDALLKDNASYYEVYCLTKRVVSNLTYDSIPITFETAQIWSAPVYDTEHPQKMFFKRHRGFVQLIIKDRWLSTEEILKIVRLNLPQLFLERE